MAGKLRAFLDRWRFHPYGRRQAMVLINGLAEQAESWFHNHRSWRRYYDVHMPNILAYDGAALHRRIDSGEPVSVDYLVDQLHLYLDQFVQTPPYHFVAASLGGKVAVEYAVRYPDEVDKLVLLCPSGMGDEERLPVVEGVRRNDLKALVDSVFFDPRYVDPDLVSYYQRQFTVRRWRSGLLRTIRGTMEHCVRERLAEVRQPTLLVAGREDRIVDPRQAETAARGMVRGQFVLVPWCGHAPQMEKPRVINRMVLQFLWYGRALPQRRFGRLLPAKAGTG